MWPHLFAAAFLLQLKRLWNRQKLRRIKSSMVFEAAVVKKGFECVAEAFKRSIEKGEESGAQLVIYVDGEKVIDVAGGADEKKALRPHSLAMVFSCTKVIESLVVAMLVDKGKLAYDQPIAKYWPEFGKVVSPECTVSDLMRHQAGVAAFDELLTVDEAKLVFNDTEKLKDYLERNKPLWKPQRPPTRQMYHACTRGQYVAVLCKLVDGRDICTFVREEILQNVEEAGDFSIGATLEQQPRIAHHFAMFSLKHAAVKFLLHKLFLHWLFFSEDQRLKDFELELFGKLLFSKDVKKSLRMFKGAPSSIASIANTPEIRAIPMPSATGCGNARSLAAIANQIVQGRYLTHKGLEDALTCNPEIHSVVKDEGLCRKAKMANCGWGLDRFEIFVPNSGVGWAGAGGSLLTFNLKPKFAFAYVTNHLNPRLYKARALQNMNSFQQALAQVKTSEPN